MNTNNKARKTSSAMFLDLPVELRLRIAEYALEQRPAVGIPHIGRQLQDYQGDYRPSENLALLLVCRQFNSDFTQLAFSKTRFPVWNHRQSTGLQGLPPHKLRSIRSIVHRSWGTELNPWGKYCYDLEQLRLDEFVLLCDDSWFVLKERMRAVIAFMRRLLHVKTVKFVMYGVRKEKNRSDYCSLIGAIMKEDHFQRYDAPGAPNIEATWWDWRLNPQANMVTFTAQHPRPILPEEEYMLLMKPKVDAMMAEAERAAGL
jgi:hypothetical protein